MSAQGGGRRAFLVTAGWGLAAPSFAQQAEPPPRRLQEFVDQARAPDVIDLLQSAANCRRFAALVRAARFEQRLRSMADVTVFSPVDSGWKDAAAADAASRDPALAARLVSRYVCGGRWDATGDSTAELTALDGSRLTASVQALNGIAFFAQRLRVGNGWLHLLQEELPA